MTNTITNMTKNISNESILKSVIININKSDNHLNKHVKVWSMSTKIKNSLVKAYNGNIVKLLHLNKSKSNILLKHSLIKDLLDKEDPEIGSFNESNCDITKQAQLNPFKGYKTEHKTLKYKQNETTVSRTTMI